MNHECVFSVFRLTHAEIGESIRLPRPDSILGLRNFGSLLKRKSGD